MQVLWRPSQLLYTLDVTFGGNVTRHSCNRSPRIQSHIAFSLGLWRALR